MEQLKQITCPLNSRFSNYRKAFFTNYENADEAILHGSRAKRNYKPGSDLDELLLPYTFGAHKTSGYFVK